MKCKFKGCYNNVYPKSSTKTVRNKLLQVYCRNCVDVNFEDNGMPTAIMAYGGTSKLWIDYVDFAMAFGRRHGKVITEMYPVEPTYIWNTRVHRKDKKTIYDLLGTADLDEWVLDLYIRRSPSPEKLMDTFVHELTHFITFTMFNDIQFGELQGHTPLFWKLFFSFCEHKGIEYIL